jgi:hypothetical protein
MSAPLMTGCNWVFVFAGDCAWSAATFASLELPGSECDG